MSRPMRSGRSGRTRSRSASSASEEFFEEPYEHAFTDHLGAVGDASASLGLISTLVFSICMSNIMGMDDDGTAHEMKMLFVSLACAFSTYTTTYSLLEYYYVQTLKGVDSFMAHQVNVQQDNIDQDNPNKYHSFGQADQMDEETPRPRCSSSSEQIMEDRAKLTDKLEVAFATFNNMRMWARNSMWYSLICLLGSAVAKVDLLSVLAPDLARSHKCAVFFSVTTCGLVSAWCSGFQSRDIQAYIVLSLVGLTAASLEARFVWVGLDTSKMMSTLFLITSIVVIPFTVRCFRGTYLVMAKEYARIY